MKKTSKHSIVLRPWQLTIVLLALLLVVTIATTTISNAVGSETFVQQLGDYKTYLPLVFQDS
jgi:hypothetical protein